MTDAALLSRFFCIPFLTLKIMIAIQQAIRLMLRRNTPPARTTGERGVSHRRDGMPYNVGAINLEGRLRAGSLEYLPDGRTVRLTGKQDGPSARLTPPPAALRRFRRWNGRVRRISADGSGFPDLPKVIELAARNLPRRSMAFRLVSPWRMGDRVRHPLRQIPATGRNRTSLPITTLGTTSTHFG